MRSFAEVLTNNQANNINTISDKIGKKLGTNNSFTAYNKSKSSTGVATISNNPNKTKPVGAATINVNSKSNSRANASVEDDGSSGSHDCKEEATDTRKGKRKHVTNFNINKKVVREKDDSHPPAEDEPYLICDLDEQIDRLVDTTNSYFCK